MTNSHVFSVKPYLLLRWSADNSAGVNCWGLVREFYHREYGVDLPAYQISADNIRAIIRESENAVELANWVRVESPEFGDVCQLTQSVKAQHYAIYVGDGQYLHAQPGFSPIVADVQGLRDAGYRILHTWRRNVNSSMLANFKILELAHA